MGEYERHRKACSNKSKYAYDYVARRALERMIASGRGGDVSKLKVYTCLFCNAYHIGHDHKTSERKSRRQKDEA